MKKCPFCAEDIQDQAVVCRYCHRNLVKKPLGDDPVARMLLPVGRSGLAIAAGYLGLFSFLVVPAPISLVVGLLAIADIKNNPSKHGMGRAVFGVIMGIAGSLLLFIYLLTRGRS